MSDEIRQRAIEYRDGALLAVRADLTTTSEHVTDADKWALAMLADGGEQIVADVLELLDRLAVAAGRTQQLENALAAAQLRFTDIEGLGDRMTGDEDRPQLAHLIGLMAGSAERGKDIVAMLLDPNADSAGTADTPGRAAQLEAALRRAIVYVKNMEMPDTGVIGPAGEREHDYHRAGLADEIREWETLLASAGAADGEADRG